MNRRHFLQTTALAAAAAAHCSLLAAPAAKGARWPIGCLNRPWVNPKLGWTDDTALDGIKAAGYKCVGLLRRSEKEPLLGSDATPEYLAALKKKIADRGLTTNMGALRVNTKLPLEGQIQDLRKQIDNAQFMGVQFLLTFGVNTPAEFEPYCRLMRDAAAYSHERSLQLVMKPHGSDAGEITRTLERVGHKNYSVWFDPGNIIFYNGKDPVEQFKAIAPRVTGMCAKDCDGIKGKVDIEFGTGKVDFPALFREAKRAGFHGPLMVECCALADTPEAVTASARKNRELLEKVLAAL